MNALATLTEHIARTFLDGARAAVGSVVNQVGGTFVLPGSTFSIGALLVSLAVMVVLVLARRKRPVRIKVLARALFPRRLTRSRSGRTDLLYFVGGIAFSGLAIGWAIVGAADVQRIIVHVVGPPRSSTMSPWLAMPVLTIMLFIAGEFAYWLDHQLKHRVALFWHFRKVHHQAESLSLFTNGRVHPVDTIIFANIVAGVMGTAGAIGQYLFGDAIHAVTIYGTNALVMVTSVAIAHLQHSHLWVRFGARGSLVLLGPAHHQIHHSVHPDHFNRNLGNTLTVFDRLFGTFCLPSQHREAIRFGVEDGEHDTHGWRAALLTPFAAAARDVTAATRRVIPRPIRRQQQ